MALRSWLVRSLGPRAAGRSRAAGLLGLRVVTVPWKVSVGRRGSQLPVELSWLSGWRDRPVKVSVRSGWSHTMNTTPVLALDRPFSANLALT
jgi:hypothetical protein